MSRKIVVLNGSPRPKGNFLDKMNIHGCKGCFGGVMKVGDIKGHKEFNEAYELGKGVANGNGL